MKKWLRKGFIAVLAMVLLLRLLERRGVMKSRGVLLGIPYDLRTPTMGRVKERFWNPADPRMLTPKVFGWGYSVNIPAVLLRMGIRRDHWRVV